MVGAHREQADNEDGGAAYVFLKQSNGQYSMHQKLTAPEGQGHDYHYFGIAVAMEESHVLVGAAGDNKNGVNSGAVFVYGFSSTFGNYFSLGKLTPANARVCVSIFMFVVFIIIYLDC